MTASISWDPRPHPLDDPELRAGLRNLLDLAARARGAAWDAWEDEMLFHDRICGQCGSEIPESRGKTARYCQDICRKRSHYAADVTRMQRRRAQHAREAA